MISGKMLRCNRNHTLLNRFNFRSVNPIAFFLPENKNARRRAPGILGWLLQSYFCWM